VRHELRNFKNIHLYNLTITMSAKIHFYIRTNRPQKDGSVPVFLFFIINRRQRLQVGTGQSVPLKKEHKKMCSDEIRILPKAKREELYCWDNKTERITKSAPGWEAINLQLEVLKAKANQVILKYQVMGKPLTIQAFKAAFLRPEGTDAFKEYFTHELKTRKHLLSKGTYIGYMATVSKLSNFRPNLLLGDIDYKLLTQFENHMLKPQKEGGLGNMPSTIAKTMRTIRTLLLIAVKNNDFPKEAYPFQDYKIKNVDPLLTTRDYLEPEDLLKIEQLLSPENISRLTPGEVRATQRFLFACYTGLRFTDVNSLHWKSHVFSKYVFNPGTKEMVFRSYIEITMAKTSLPVFIPLINKAIELMGERSDGFVFQPISNQKVNAHLKEINKKATLNKKLSFHVARHSFATICFLYGIPLEVGQKLLGHKNRKFTEIYTHLSKNKLFYEMDKLNRGLNEYEVVLEEIDNNKQNLKEMLPMLQQLTPEKLEQVKGLLKVLK
jgi:site-specific recombinase XerD